MERAIAETELSMVYRRQDGDLLIEKNWTCLALIHTFLGRVSKHSLLQLTVLYLFFNLQKRKLGPSVGIFENGLATPREIGRAHV